MFATLVPSNGSLFLPHYSGFQPICHIVYWNVKFVVLCFISQNIFIWAYNCKFQLGKFEREREEEKNEEIGT
jgi:hypothetical protein